MNAIKLHGRFLSLQHRLGGFWPIVIGFVIMFGVMVMGVAAYMTIEGWPFFDSLYQVIITLSTVGFQEVNPLSEQGRAATMLLIVCGVGSFAYLVGSFTQVLIEGRLQKIFGRRRVQKAIDKLSGHIIVCGCGRIGAIVTEKIMAEGQRVVVIEKDLEVVRELEEKGILHLAGDATDDEMLLGAGIERAKSLVAALHQEAANVYVTLTARQINAGLFIVARADSPPHIPKLKRAGADQVLIPHLFGGVRMAQSVLRPTVTSFLELALSRSDIDLQMEELRIEADSEVVNQNLIESKIRPRFDLIVIGIKKSSGEMVFNPQPQAVLEAGDTMILVGKRDDLDRLRAIL
ncbi:potassium channel family protein [Desulfolutivibrio sulfoxidireducens]|uniref:potassium channel family protein n=1 Tax=Desulfolutivibrio sulfoxidireducens TaxID=2773299 RepID=UPI00159DDB13|nr:potassium channel protein [Desulfolutivibrio sulfoxidireducens]QLA16286.1 potassium channel protein [Desulfolutivibrio sulfoxidireducens]QLA19822.1 potassium channel protein [Desulfolutivibrio sulfoxidireducens]